MRILLSLTPVTQHCLRFIREIACICGSSFVLPEQYSTVLILPQCVYLLLLWMDILVVSSSELFMNKASINIYIVG